MATYNPPTQNLSTFDSIVFQQVSPDSGLTIAQGDLRYLKFPIAQGGETLPSATITGALSAGSASVSGATTLSGGTTISTDITLNKASGQQAIVSSAPTGIVFQTTTNGAPISFNVQSSGGTYTNVMQVIANNNPRIQCYLSDIKINDRTTTSYGGELNNNSVAGGTFTMRSMSTTGNGNIQIDASTSTSGTATGSITLKTKDGTPSTTTGLILQGTALTAATAGGSAGLHLCLTINGVLYKIALLNA